MKISDAAVRKLLKYSWPGNIRELQNCIERAVILCDGQIIGENDVLTVSAAHAGSIADYLNLQGPLPDVRKRAADEAERHAILQAWKDHDENLDQAARALGVSSKTLASKLKDLGIRS
jgi:DNA-binding NtrC family response regulator